MRENEFQDWLRWRGATSDGAIKTRTFAVRKIEENLASFGSSNTSLEEEYEGDGFASLRERLKEIREDAQSGGQDYRVLMPDSENPHNRLVQWRSWLGQYGQFLADHDGPETNDAFDQAMEQLHATFLERMDQFDNLASEDGTFWEVEKSYKQDARGAVVAANADPQSSPADRGKAIYEQLCQNAGQGLPLSWRTKGEVFAASSDVRTRFFETIASLASPKEDAGVLAEQAARSLEALRDEGIPGLKRGEVLNIVLSVLGTFRPKDACWFKSRLFDQAARYLSQPRLFPSYHFDLDEFEQFQSFMLKIQSWLDDRGMKPENFEDVQGFLWVALAKDWEDENLVVEGLTRAAVEAAMDEFDEIGLDGFKTKYGYGKPQRYWVQRPSNDDLYPAKAIAGVAYGHIEGGQPKSVQEFYAGYGEQQANGILAKLGYEIVEKGSERPFVLFDTEGQEYQPTRTYNRQTGASAFRLQRPGTSNRTNDAEEVEDIIDVARAMLLEGRLARVKRTDGTGPANYIGYGKTKLVRYRLDAELARQLGVPEQDGSDADKIRHYALHHYIKPAQNAGDASVEILVRDVNEALGLNQAWPNICQALAGNKFQQMTGLPAPSRIGADMSSATIFKFRLSGESKSMSKPTSPTNLILYGPPGTGKTFNTAQEAVRLCDGQVPSDREGLMARYQELVAAKRIGFVTFHQNFSYEDFVEGLRPAPIDTDEGSAAGFQLQPEPGIFRRIAEQAQTSGLSKDGEELDLERRTIFKMSLGEVGKSEFDYVFRDSIDGGFAMFGFRDVDWSDEKFEDREEILSALRQRFPDEDISLNKGLVRSPDMFRNQLQVGDILIVPKGNSLFRAIGIVEGEYEYAPRADGRYSHRRKVRWLWSDPDGRDVSEIYSTKFQMNTIYRMKPGELDLPAIAALISGDGAQVTKADPLPHVLIIDEINRANISKVFGELITLLEPDKRLGMPNALSVTLPYSKKSFGVPANLHVIGTMNTADRSIALLDTALRRRFRFKELAPDTSVRAFKDAVQATGLSLDAILDTINDRIEYLIDREHRIGHAFFIGCQDRSDVEAVMRDKVIPLLQEYFFEDWSRIHAVLGDGFIGKRELQPPPGIDGDNVESWHVQPKFAQNAFERLLGKEPTADESETS
ncbi:AAA family ATPase [Erythrobacter sp.]|uniref:AAA family ATPase n=1 Tax=Erythrobacter sp. TaxID=1042 RepID=UPI001B04310F|nr:AAA family ATPase [Erythrobacter sp.]MBO6525642.1 AAA family ATPase [Erythrobacter sp.]MBO6529685.1 AAA family ATPase [Erythrobacter sp.]